MTPTPYHMTGAELQTLREAAGMTREALAELASVAPRTVKHWETRTGAGVPADVVPIILQAARWVIFAAGEAFYQVVNQPEPPAEVVLLRYRETAHMHPQDTAQGLRADVHGAMVSRLTLDLMHNGYTPRVVWFDPQAYTQWLATQATNPSPAPDTHATRAAWAAQALEQQAIPHPGDQPPAHNSANP
jgi:transcriptional regulator with XRE-family HTH domain